MYSKDIAVRIKELSKEIDSLASKDFSLSDLREVLAKELTLVQDISAGAADSDSSYDSWPGLDSLPINNSVAKNPEDTFGDDFGWDSK